jgi:sodium/bile acid cotransporter 7
MIVFSTFAESFSQNLFKGFTLQTLGILSGFLLVFLLVVVGILYVTATWGNFSSADRITAIFCGSTKSLVHGVAMGKVLFASSMTLGLVLLPVMLYHLQQLVLGSLLARFFEEKASKIEK